MKRVLIKLLRHYTKPHRKLRLFTSGSSQSVRADQQDGEFLHLCAAQYSTYCGAQALLTYILTCCCDTNNTNGISATFYKPN